MDLSHLSGLTKLECLEEFEGIPAGTLVPLRVWKETKRTKEQVTRPDGILRDHETVDHHMLLTSTAAYLATHTSPSSTDH